MALSGGKHVVNPKGGKPSYIAIDSDTDLFDKNTTTIQVTDNEGITWSATPKGPWNPRTLIIRLKGRQSAIARAQAVAAEALTDDAGQLTVTVTNVTPNKSVDIPVLYVDDPTP